MSGAYPLVALIVLDGWGLAPDSPGNAVTQARTPVFDGLNEVWPTTTLVTHGRSVGLPQGQMGNSEVGHLNLGSGRAVPQDIVRIDDAIEDGSFFENEVLVKALSSPGRTHLMGLVSDGGVHSCHRHYIALLELARRLGREGDEVVFHAFTDGRDVAPGTGADHLQVIQDAADRAGTGHLGTVIGRFYAMDRDQRWGRTHTAFRALVGEIGEVCNDPVARVRERYGRGQTDEFLQPIIVRGAPRIESGDQVLFFNFRADRARQLCRVLGDAWFDPFDREGFVPVPISTLTKYDQTFPFAKAFEPVFLEGTLGSAVADAGMRQLRISESEKYAHVTYFFNGRREEPYDGEKRVMIPSPKVQTYDAKPEMSAAAVTDAVCAEISRGAVSLVVLNYANPDMVGHTGVLEAAVRAVETVDTCLGRVLREVEAAGGAAIITADHGNCERMIDLVTGKPHTFHTTNPVPLILAGAAHRGAKLAEGAALSAIAPTICELLGVAVPAEMQGESLVVAPGIVA